MANITAKTSSNVFYKARCEAAKHNEQLSSREGAADIMSIDRGRLYRIERSIINPYPEEIRLMANLYNAPELQNHYCTSMCPLGSNIPQASAGTLDRISLKMLDAFRKVKDTKELLIDIVADGVIDDSEKPQLDKILGTLDELEQAAQSLKIWVKKNL